MMLFEPIRIGKMELRNRIVFPPIGTELADPGGFVNDNLLEYYRRRAAGGAGLIVVEFSGVDPHRYASKRQIHISDDKFLEGLSKLARTIRAEGAKACIQIHHPGRQNFQAVTGLQPVAPSAIPCPVIREMPKELTVGEIEDLIEKYIAAGLRAQRAGFDCVQLHGAHGYLICQFFSPFSNQRNDEYGGDVFRRTKFAREIIKGLKQHAGKDFPVILRFSADEHVPGGIDLEQGKEIARIAVAEGADCIDVSAGNYASGYWTTHPMFMPRGALVPSAKAIREVVNVPVVAVGRISDAAFAEKVLQEGSADLIGMARALLADPDLPNKSLRGQAAKVRHCIACNTCQDRVLRMVDISCLVNPELGKENFKEEPAAQKKKLLIVGGGPAALEAARVARVRGHDVTLWDENPKLGGRWSWLINGCIKQRTEELKTLGVKIELGHTTNRAAIDQFRPDAVLVTRQATTATPAFPIKGNARVLTADAVLDQDLDVGRSAAIFGGGNAGCEVAEHLRKKKVAATIVESSERMATGVESITRRMLLERLAEKNVQFWTSTQVREVDGSTIIAEDKQGNEKRLAADSVVVALGYKAQDVLLESLEGAPYESQPLPFCDVARRACDCMLEGGRIARGI